MLNKVYVIDDDEISLFLSKFIIQLHTPASNCVCFDNAPDALPVLKQDILHDTLPALILLDLNMPIMNGLDFLEALKPYAAALGDQCFICILTSSVDEQDLLRSLGSGLVLDLIQKPLTQEKLAEVSTVLERLRLPVN
jgi:CheY-like chemotaxis protein